MPPFLISSVPHIKLSFLRTFEHCWWDYKLVLPLWKKVWKFLKKSKIELPYNPAILLLGIYPKEMKTLTPKGICIPTFIAALFIIAKTQKLPKCTLMDEWVKKLWYIYTTKHYLSIKTKQILPFIQNGGTLKTLY